ncbi:MAG: hypothetical protein AB7H97_17485, partial [Pseudobdellovibrionaceae bacterium]
MKIEQYFIAASKVEGLKILMGQKVDPRTWKTIYALTFPLEKMSQLRFMQVGSIASDAFTKLPGINEAIYIKRASMMLSLRSHLDLNQRTITLSLSPAFLEIFERQVMVDQMTTKSSLKFAGHFSVHKLLESQIATRMLMRQSPENMPEVPAFWAEKFPSMKVKKEEAILAQQQIFLEGIKPELFEALKRGYVNLELRGKGLVLNDAFYNSLADFGKFPLHEPPDLELIGVEEMRSWSDALLIMMTFWNMSNLQDTAKLVYETKRLSLRWTILGSRRWTDLLGEEGIAKAAALIDEKSKEFADAFMQDIELQQVLSNINRGGRAKVAKEYRENFQKNLVANSKTLQAYETNRVNLRALVGANQNDIKALLDSNPSHYLREAVEALNKAKSYEEGNNVFMQMMGSMLLAYRAPKIPPPVTLTKIEKYKDQFVFEPKTMEHAIPEKYLNAMAENGQAPTATEAVKRFFRGGANMRKQDLDGMIELGKLMRFDQAGELDLKNEKITPKSLNLADGLLAPLFGSQKRQYHEELKREIMANAPILNGEA